jgi:antitoxin component YwqK of YwqJK toxin-antitoxin module
MNLKKIVICLVCFVFVFSTSQCQTNNQSTFNCTDCNQKNAQGKKTGLWIEDNGLREVYYKNNKRDGLYKTYSRKTGKLSALGEYKNGDKSGTWFYFNEKSQLIMIEKELSLNTENSVKRDDGVKITPKFKSYIIFYYTTGNIKEEGVALYDEDIEIDFFKSGQWKYYDKEGKLIKTENK